MFALVGDGRLITQRGMQPHAVVKAHDVVGNVGHRHGMIGVVALPDPLSLFSGSERGAPSPRYPSRALTTYAHRSCRSSTARWGCAGVLAALILMHHRARSGLAVRNGHL